MKDRKKIERPGGKEDRKAEAEDNITGKAFGKTASRTRERLRGMPVPIGGRRILVMTLVLVLATAALLLAGKCSHRNTSPFGGEMPEKSGGDTIDVAIEISPLSYFADKDSISGLDYELLMDMSRRYGRAVKFHPFAPMAYAMRGLREGVFDVIVSSLPSVNSLKDSLLLTRSVYLDREVLVQRKADTAFVHRAEDLARREVWIADGSPLAERIHNLAEEIGDTVIVRTRPGYTAEHLVLLVGSGDIPNAVVNEGIAKRMCKADTTLSSSTPVSFTQFQVWAVSPENKDMKATLDTWIREYRRTPAYGALLSRYGMRAPR